MYNDLLKLNIKEIEEKFNERGEGSSRKVYSSQNIKNIVLKYAFNEKGEEQNKVEYNIYNKFNKKYFNILRPILACSEKIIVCKKALPLNILLQQNLRIHEYEELCYLSIFELLKDNKIKSILDLNETKIERLEEIINDFIKESGLLREDIERIDSWGVINDKLVLIDYGCTEKLFKEMYS